MLYFRCMQDYRIDVSKMEEWQMTNNLHELERVFEKAKSAIVNGALVILERTQPGGRKEKFEELSTLEDFENYRRQVMKYL